MNSLIATNKTSIQKRIIFSLLFVFIIAVIIICSLMIKVFNKNLAGSLQTQAEEMIDIIDYMAQTSGESPELIRGVKTLAANRDIKLIIVRINKPPVVIASNKTALIGLPTNEIFSIHDENHSFNFDIENDQYTATSSIWLENRFNDGEFTKASVGIVFDTFDERMQLQQHIINTTFYLVLTLLFAIGIVYFLTRKHLFRPLENINSSLKNTNSHSDFYPISIERNDEIGSVANTLNNVFSELYASKKLLRENTERYDLALQGTKVGVIDWNIEEDTLCGSASILEILGVNSDNVELSMDLLKKLTHPDDKELAYSALVSHLKFNNKYDIELRLRHENGNYIWIRARGQSVRDEHGRAVRMVGYYVDITKRKKHEEYMHSFYQLLSDLNISLEEKLNRLIEVTCKYLNLEAGIIGKIENNKYFTLYCHAPECYKINKTAVLKLSDTLCQYTIRRNDIFSIHNIKNSEFSNHKSHTRFKINSYIAFPLYIQGRLYGTINFFDKKSKNRPFEEREKSFIRLISQSIANEIMRTQYIEYLHETENRLEDAVDELRKTNAELESFTYVASHDLQEPLRMITNFTGILEKYYGDKLDETAQEYLKISSKSADQMRLLIKDLLEYAHASIENERIENVQLNEILEHVYANLEKQIRETNAHIVFKNLPIVEANKASMISLLQNLINNGIKFQPQGNIPVIAIHSYERNDKWVISVRDNGIGISSQYQHKIFEPFKRLHAKSEYKGTGIGLAVCKKIVQRMGGTMWIESDQTSGSTFFFTIPKTISQTGKAA